MWLHTRQHARPACKAPSLHPVSHQASRLATLPAEQMHAHLNIRQRGSCALSTQLWFHKVTSQALVHSGRARAALAWVHMWQECIVVKVGK